MPRFYTKKRIVFLSALITVILSVAVVVCSCQSQSEGANENNEISKEANFGETAPENLNDTQIALMEKIPQYFGLDASNGLDVYVWQMAENSYSFGLLPHSENERDWLSEDLMTLVGVRYNQMREILATYDISEEEIFIVPWQNPLSSYIGGVFRIENGETDEHVMVKTNAYIEYVREMLFDEDFEDPNKKPTPVLLYSAPVYSYVIEPSLVPSSFFIKVDGAFQVEENILYDSATDTVLGEYNRVALSESDFVQMMGRYGEEYSELGKDIQRNNNYAYEIQPIEPNVIDIYYILLQNDKSILVVYGHYESGEKTNEIRWIFDAGNDRTGVFYQSTRS